MYSRSLTFTRENKRAGLIRGVALTVVLTLVARQLAMLPLLNIMGSMILAIILGMSWRSFMGVPAEAEAGINYIGQKILRLGMWASIP